MEETKLTFEQLENAGDLEDYYTHGPGVPFNKHLGCRLGTAIQDSIEKALAPGSQQGTSSGMKKRKDKEKEEEEREAGEGDDDEGEAAPTHYKFVLKFGHSETIFFFSTFLVSFLSSQSLIPRSSSFMVLTRLRVLCENEPVGSVSRPASD